MITIIEEVLEGEVLKVKVETKLKASARIPTRKYKTEDVIKILPSKYEVVSWLREDIVSNSKRGNHKQLGEWQFIVKIVRVAAPPKKPTTKTVPNKKPAAPKKPPAAKAPPQPKPLTKGSIRGRMSKIAKQKNN